MLLLAVALPTVAATAPASEPALRRAEQVDTSRLGRVGEDERALLRVEWRSARSAQAEAEQVQGMLDSLRRMEGTVAEIGRLLRSLPAQGAPAPAAAPPDDDRLGGAAPWLAGAAVLVLAALWLGRRRGSVPTAPVAMEPAVAGGQAPAAIGEVPPPAEASAEPPPSMAPAVTTPLPDLPAIAPAPVSAEIAAGPPPPPTIAEAPPTAPEPEAPVVPEPDHEPLEFTLEEADPESVARAEARERQRPPPEAADDGQAATETHSEPTLELAEIMLSMGLEQSAAQALVEYSEANPRQAVYHWLKLLDIYRGSGHRKDFKETAEKLRQHFNIQADDWTRARGGDAPSLEGFGRIIGHIQALWGRAAECEAYLRHLIEDNREGTRAGFPQPVAEEILLLIEILADPEDTQAAAPTRVTT